MRDVDQFFNEVPEHLLFHYTSIESLLKIQSSEALFASHGYYLNDSQELLYGCGALRREVVRRMEESVERRSEEDVRFFRCLLRWLDSFSGGYPIFIFSLSQQPDLLSQWRSYTRHGKGVAFGFSPQRMQSILASNLGFRLARCLYTKEQHEHLVRVLLEMCLVSLDQHRAENERPLNDDQMRSFLEQYRGDFLRVMAIIKHEAFSEEQEWRLISPYFPRLSDCDLKFREGAAMLVPYIEVKLPQEQEPNLLFDIVVLGPSKHPNLAMSALSAFLFKSRACSHVRNVNIPYREW